MKMGRGKIVPGQFLHVSGKKPRRQRGKSTTRVDAKEWFFCSFPVKRVDFGHIAELNSNPVVLNPAR